MRETLAISTQHRIDRPVRADARPSRLLTVPNRIRLRRRSPESFATTLRGARTYPREYPHEQHWNLGVLRLPISKGEACPVAGNLLVIDAAE